MVSRPFCPDFSVAILCVRPLTTDLVGNGLPIVMTYSFRHRATFEPLSVAHALSLKSPRLSTPIQWDWTWPLHTSSRTGNEITPKSDQPPSTDPSIVCHVWLSAIDSIAVSDHGAFIAFSSHRGTVAVARLDTDRPPASLFPPPYLPSPATAEWCANATSLVFFQIQSKSLDLRTILCVGYESGAVAFYDPSTAILLALSKVDDVQPVRQLRFYPTLHYVNPNEPATYPRPSANAALLAVLGIHGLVARITSDELLALLERPSPSVDAHGAGWVKWNLSAQSVLLDAVICGSAPSSICDFDASPPTAPLRLVVSGICPSLATYSVTPDPIFSARAAAKRAASSVLSAARGFIFSRLSVTEEQQNHQEEPRTSITAVVRHVASWSDQPNSALAFQKLLDAPNSARAFTFSSGVSSSYSRSRDDSTLLKKVFSQRRTGSDIVHPSQGLRATSNVHGDTVRSASASNAAGYNLKHGRSVSTTRSASIRFPGFAKNARVVAKLMAAPPPCSLVATCDSLGRIFLQDPRDYCILRVLKGYREANIAWMYDDGPLLFVHAPRLNVVEIHAPLEQKRREAFRIHPGSVLIQSTSHNVFCMFPDGRLFQATRSLSKTNSVEAIAADTPFGSGENLLANPPPDCPENAEDFFDVYQHGSGSPSDYELTGTFIDSVKNGHEAHAVECLQKVEDNAFKVARLMAVLVVCTTDVSTDIHIALASKASEISSKLKNPDLVCKFEAYRRLAEGFSLLATDNYALELSVNQKLSAKYGPTLIEDEIGVGLAEFGGEHSNSLHYCSNSRMDFGYEPKVATCEQFVLSHCIVPVVDIPMEVEYEIRPRTDLSEEEDIGLAKTYFSKLLEYDSGNTPTVGREHPTTTVVFAALEVHVGLTGMEIVRRFFLFILYTPLLALLNTFVSTYASPLRCAVARIRSQVDPEMIDPILIDICENTGQIANAVLLMRLYRTNEDEGVYVDLSRRLNEVLLYRRLVAGSNVPAETVNMFTAKESTGTPGDAERHAVIDLIASNDFGLAQIILNESQAHRPSVNLSPDMRTLVSIAALYACRLKVAEFLKITATEDIPANVLAWIQEVDCSSNNTTSVPKSIGVSILREIRTILIMAHTYIPDSSVDAVRSLQLAEAMSTLIQSRKTEASNDDDNHKRDGCVVLTHLSPGNVENISVNPETENEEVFYDIAVPIEADHESGWELEFIPTRNDFNKDGVEGAGEGR